MGKKIRIAQETLQILPLFYCQDLTQEEIAEQLFDSYKKQSTVSRRLQPLRQHLLETLMSWTTVNLHKTITSELINDMSQLIELWLERHICAETSQTEEN